MWTIPKTPTFTLLVHEFISCFPTTFPTHVSRFYTSELENMLDGNPGILHQQTSVLLSSLLRCYLRLEFYELIPRVETEGGMKSFHKSLSPKLRYYYERLDLGAAIHHACDVLHTNTYAYLAYESLLKTNELEEKTIRQILSLGEIDSLQRYVSAHVFLRGVLEVYVALDLSTPEGIYLCACRERIEKYCTVIEKYHFEDEMHLAPLASSVTWFTKMNEDAANIELCIQALRAKSQKKVSGNFNPTEHGRKMN